MPVPIRILRNIFKMTVKLVSLLVVASVLVLVATSPIKEKDIDDIIYRLAEMRTDLHLDGKLPSAFV